MAVVLGDPVERGEIPLVSVDSDAVDDKRAAAVAVGRDEPVGDPAARPAKPTDCQLHT